MKKLKITINYIKTYPNADIKSLSWTVYIIESKSSEIITRKKTIRILTASLQDTKVLLCYILV
jgi:hypothetical protein